MPTAKDPAPQPTLDDLANFDLQSQEGRNAIVSAWTEKTEIPLVCHDLDGRVVYLNKAAARLLNRPRHEVLDQHISEHFGAEWFSQHLELAAAGTLEERSYSTKLRFVVDGEDHLYRIDTELLSTTDQTITVACLALVDITEDVQARNDLQRANQALSESNRDLEEFAYVASHDLQEPLRKIQAFGERLKGRLDDTEDDRALDYLDRMQNASERMQVLISDLLSFSRVTTSGRELAPVPLEEVVDSVLQDLEVAVSDAGATIHVGSLPTIDGDRPQLQQLLQNLLGNALKFRADDRDLEIWVEAVLIGSRWLVSVRDTGIGFEQNYAEKIFTVFQRLHGRSSYEGTGVGLAICRRIVERHGGTIRAQGEEGEGATFLIDLPRSLHELQAVAA